MNADLVASLKGAVLGFDSPSVRKGVEEAIRSGASASEVIEALRSGMEAVGERYRAGELFVTDLIIAGEVMKEAQELLEPSVRGSDAEGSATVLVATVAGDVHDIGKSVFVMLLRAEGLKVIDLGVDVSAEKIVDAVREHRPEILGLSALLTTNLEEFPRVIDDLKRSEMRDGIKVIVGGATVTEQFAKEVGVDAYAKNAADGVDRCRDWLKHSGKLKE